MMGLVSRTRFVPSVFLVAGLVGTAIAASAILLVMQHTSYDAWAALFVGPALVLASLPAFRRQAARQQDPRLFRLLVIALLLKLAAAFVQLYVNNNLYGGGADSVGYHENGAELSEQFLRGDFDTGMRLSGTRFLQFLTGLVYMVIRPTTVGGYLVFAWLGFWGLFCFYRAFTIAVPEGNSRSYAHLVFFLPSLLFWGSSIGKESWMMFALGIAALGSAHVLSRRSWRGLVITGLGLWGASLARPHIAALLALALAVAYVTHSVWARSNRFHPAMVALVIPILILLASNLVSSTEEFFRETSNIQGSGVTPTLSEVHRRTSQGGSEFTASVVDSPRRVPVAAVTVLFRPFPTEADNAQALVTAIEGTFLILLVLVRYKWIIAAARSVRRQPYVVLALAYVVAFVIAYSSIANFGILARQRVQMLPLFLVLLAIPPKQQVPAPTADEHVSTQAGPGVER
jgi:hypothetical protein